MKTIALNDATVLGASQRASILIRSGQIEAIDEHSFRHGVDLSFDLAGHTVLPGFIDLHNHGAVNIDVMNASADDLLVVSKFLAAHGVTSWLPTLVPGSDENYEGTVRAVADAMQMRSSGARILGVHYEGPFVNLGQCGALHREHFKTYVTPSDLNRFPVPTIDNAVKMMTLAPEIAGGIDLVKELSRRGWIVSIGHTRAELDTLELAFGAGARHMTHFMNAMSPLHHRNPGPVAWGLSRDEVSLDIIADGIHLHPFMLGLLLRMKGTSGLALISDSIAATGKGDGEYEIWGEKISVVNGRTSNSEGTIAGSVITMLDAVRVMRSVGASLEDVTRMASFNPAKLLRLDHEIGELAVGRVADLVAMDEKGNVRLTVVGGEVAFAA